MSGRGRGGGRGRGRGTDKSIQMPDLMGQTMSEVGSASLYHTTSTDKPPSLFPPTYIKRFMWEEKDVDQGAELYMMKKMVGLESWNLTSPFNLDHPSDGTVPGAQALQKQFFARSTKRLLAFVGDVRYSDLYTKEAAASKEATVGVKRARAGAYTAPMKKRVTIDLELLAAEEKEAEVEDVVDGEEVKEGTGAPRRRVGEEDELDDDFIDEEDEEDYNDYTEFHDDAEDDDGDGDYDGGGGGDY
jgi:hypothetical protein